MKIHVGKFVEFVVHHWALWQEKWQAYIDAEDQKYYADPIVFKRNMGNAASKFAVCFGLYLILYILIIVPGK